MDFDPKAFVCVHLCRTVPEIMDPVFAKTSQNARFLLSENERFGLVFVKTGSINSGTGQQKDSAAKYSMVANIQKKFISICI